jgi:hypothetical protein
MQEAAFAQLKVWQSGAIAVIFFLSPNITLQAMLNLMTTSLSITLQAILKTFSNTGHGGRWRDRKVNRGVHTIP